RPRIDFMAIRYYWFTATILLTVFGITVFLIRGTSGLNIDFNGGTAYSGLLTKPVEITELRDKLAELAQKQKLVVASVQPLGEADAEGRFLSFQITYASNAEGESSVRK